MRRKVIGGMIGAAVLCGGIAACVPQLVQAHLTGAFSTYLAAVYNEDTTQRLKDEMEQTRRQIAEMTPRLEELERRYTADRDEASERLLEWYNGGLDLWAGIAMKGSGVGDSTSSSGGGTVMNRLAAQYLVERGLNRELIHLDQLYVQYLQVGMTQDALAGHERLLRIIEENLAMREPYLASMGDIELETQAYYLDIDWTAEVEGELITALTADRDLVAAQWRDWISVSEADGAIELTEQWLNERSVFNYYFRSDHIYTVFDNDFANVILVAQMQRNEKQEAQFTLEGAFFNGFMVPESALVEMADITFSLSYTSLGEEAAATDEGWLEQANGRLVWTAGDR